MDVATDNELERLRTELAESQALARTRGREVEAFRRVALALNGSRELGDLLGLIARLAMELTGARQAHVVWRDDAELGRLLASGPGTGTLPGDAVRKVAACRRTLETGEAASEPNGALTCLPLLAPNRVLGALCIEGPAPDAEADADLRVLAAQAATALETAALFAALSRRSGELEQALTRYHAAEHEAHTDPLTQIANKRQFQEQGRREHAVAARYGRPYSLIIGDIDHFKAVNDQHGHVMGDGVLAAVAKTMGSVVRGADLLARWGGEEFVVLCPNTTRHEAASLAERLRAAIAQQTGQDALGAELPRVTISLGVATYDGGKDTLDEVLDRADRALLDAKASGRDRVRLA